MLLKPAGTRPEPAVSVPSANATSPARPPRPNPNSSRPEYSRVERVSRDAIWRPDARQTGGELVEVGLADQQGAGRDQSFDDRADLTETCRETGTSRGRRQTADIDIVLDREREPEEGQGIGADRGGALFKRSGRRQQPIRVNQRYPDAIVAARGDAGQHLARNFGRPHLAAPVALAHRCKVETQHSWRLPSPGMACSGWPLERQDAFRLPAKGAACRGCGRPHPTPALVDSALTRGIAGQCPHLSGWHAACCAPRARESSTGER